LADFSYYCLHVTKDIAYHITELLIFYADKLMAMGSFKHLRVFVILLESLKSQKFDAREIYMFYSTPRRPLLRTASTVLYLSGSFRNFEPSLINRQFCRTWNFLKYLCRSEQHCTT